MKRKKNRSMIYGVLVLFLLGQVPVVAQDSTKKDLLLNLSYLVNNNKTLFVTANAKTKTDGKFHPVKDIVLHFYLDNNSDSGTIAKVTTDATGRAMAALPLSLKGQWDASSKHTFLAESEANKEFDKTTAEAPFTKTKMTIDTSSEGETRTITVTVQAWNGTEWTPAKDVEMKIGVERLGGILPAGDDPTYTTDSTGTISAEFKKIGLPGDEKGNFMLVAKVEDNDQYGNLVVEKSVPWGVAFVPNRNFFDQRTLWTTRFRTPFWLLFMAYSIVVGVWGTIIYLVFQLIKIKKLASKPD